MDQEKKQDGESCSKEGCGCGKSGCGSGGRCGGCGCACKMIKALVILLLGGLLGYLFGSRHCYRGYAACPISGMMAAPTPTK